MNNNILTFTEWDYDLYKNYHGLTGVGNGDRMWRIDIVCLSENDKKITKSLICGNSNLEFTLENIIHKFSNLFKKCGINDLLLYTVEIDGKKELKYSGISPKLYEKYGHEVLV